MEKVPLRALAAFDTSPEQEDPSEVERPAGGALGASEVAGSLGRKPQGASMAEARAGRLWREEAWWPGLTAVARGAVVVVEVVVVGPQLGPVEFVG